VSRQFGDAASKSGGIAPSSDEFVDRELVGYTSDGLRAQREHKKRSK
jgi:hypothetical protein